MTAQQNAVSLIVGGMRHEGWTRVRVTAGIERVARDFAIDVTYRWPGQGLKTRVCKPFDPCVLMIGTDRILTGYIDATPISYDARSVTMGLSGRSKTADLADCSAADAPGQWNGQKVEAIAKALAAPYGVAVRAEADTGEAVSDHQVQQGETAFESLDRLLKQRQLLATDDGNGNLVFIKPGTLRATTALVSGQNIKSASFPCDWRDRFSNYVCKGQGSGSDDAFGANVSEAFGEAKDEAVSRYRMIVLQQSGQADGLSCAERAKYERDLRAARSETATVTVQGWRQADGTLWQPNMLVAFKDAFFQIDKTMLITEVTYSLDSSGGTEASLSLLPPQAYRKIG